MNCRGVSRRLSAFIDNNLSPGIRLAVEEHLQQCVYCKRQLADYESIVKAAQNLPQLTITDGFGERIIKAVNSRQETQEVLGAFRYRFTIAGVAFMVTSAAVFFLVGPPSTNIKSTYLSAEDSLMQQSPLAPDFWAHPETKVSSFPVPEGTIPQQVTENRILSDDSTIQIEEYVLPDYQRVKETVDRKF
jgi:anti-sigma factor RsiW